MDSLSIGGGWNRNGAAATIDPREASQKISARYDVIRERFSRRPTAVEAFGVPGVSKGLMSNTTKPNNVRDHETEPTTSVSKHTQVRLRVHHIGSREPLCGGAWHYDK